MRKETLEEYFSLYHRRPIIHGYVSYPPLLTIVLRRLAQSFPAAATLEALRRVGVDTVVIHRGRRGSRGMSRLAGKAAAAGVLARVAVFDQPWRVAPRVERFRVGFGFSHTFTKVVPETNEVYRIESGHVATPPFPQGRRLAAAGLQKSPSVTGAARWTAPLGDPITLSLSRPTEVSGLVLSLDRHSSWPRRFRVEAQDETGAWETLATLKNTHLLQLVDQLLANPREARLGLALPRTRVRAVRLNAERPEVSWSLAAAEIWVP